MFLLGAGVRGMGGGQAERGVSGRLFELTRTLGVGGGGVGVVVGRVLGGVGDVGVQGVGAGVVGAVGVDVGHIGVLLVYCVAGILC